MMKLACAGCGGGAPLGICAFIYFHVLLCTGNGQMMKLVCVGCGGDAVYEYLFLYVRGLEWRP